MNIIKKLKESAKAVPMPVYIAGCIVPGGPCAITALWTGYDEVKHDGVSYIQFSSGVSVKYDQSGKVVSCE